MLWDTALRPDPAERSRLRTDVVVVGVVKPLVDDQLLHREGLLLLGVGFVHRLLPQVHRE